MKQFFFKLKFSCFLVCSTNGMIKSKIMHSSIPPVIIITRGINVDLVWNRHVPCRIVLQTLKVCLLFHSSSLFSQSPIARLIGLIHTDGKRRRTPRSVEQCEREIQRLQTSLDSLRNHIGDSDQNSNDDLLALPPHSDTKMRSIISRYVSV